MVIPVYDRAHHIGQAIDSILAQSLRDFELIVVVDGSSDETSEAVARIRDPRIRLVRNTRNRGVPQTRNQGLQEARGEYLAWLDSDDLALPQRLQSQADFLDRSPEIALVGSWAGTASESGGWRPRYSVMPTQPEEVGARLLLRRPILPGSVMGRTEILKEVGYREDIPVCHDYEQFVRLFERHGLANLPRMLVRRRFHSGRATRENAENAEKKMRMNQRIAARQIEALGVDASPEDLDRHFHLPRLNVRDATPDLGFLEWAEDWCRRLAQANDARPIYEPRFLRRTLARAWLEACLYGATTSPAAALAHLRRSPMRPWAGAGLSHDLSVLLTRRLPRPSSENESWRTRSLHG